MRDLADPIQCPLCATLGEPAYEGLKDRHFSVPGTWSLIKCPGCSHHWRYPPLTDTDFLDLYADYYTHSDRSESRRRQSSFGWVREALLAKIGYADGAEDESLSSTTRGILRFPPILQAVLDECMYVQGPPEGRLLDVGCGTGRFLHRMRDLGWEVMGLEPDLRAAQMARSRYGVEVRSETVEDCQIPRGSVHVITMDHVLEHLSNPVRALTVLGELLHREGQMVMRTPNVLSLGHSLFGEDWMYLDPPRHLHLFSPESVGEVVRQAHLKVAATWTSSIRAHAVFGTSREIAQTNRADLNNRESQNRLAARIFRSFEWAAGRVMGNLGEEVILRARRE